MEKLEIQNFFSLKIVRFFLVIIFSLCLFLSFRNLIFYSENKIFFLAVLIVFFIIIWSWVLFRNIVLNNFLILIMLNFFLTPIFFEVDFEVPYRNPNSQNEIYWDKKEISGFLKNKHLISTDEKGNRVNKKIDYKKKDQDTFRFFAIGASTTEEQGLDDNLIWSNNLINMIENDQNYFKFKSFEMINFGISGTRTKHHYFTLKRNKYLKPDLVIFLLGVNDWNNHIVNSKEQFLFKNIEIAYDFRSSILFEFANRILKKIYKTINEKKDVRKITAYSKKINNPYKELVLKNINLKNNLKNSISLNIDKVSPRYSFWLYKIIDLCKKNEFKCLFVDQPSLYDITKFKTNKDKVWMNPPFKNYKIKFEDMVKIKEIYNLYLEETISSEKLDFCKLSDKIEANDRFFIDDVHFTPKGSEIVAKTLLKCINRN